MKLLIKAGLLTSVVFLLAATGDVSTLGVTLPHAY